MNNGIALRDGDVCEQPAKSHLPRPAAGRQNRA